MGKINPSDNEHLRAYQQDAARRNGQAEKISKENHGALNASEVGAGSPQSENVNADGDRYVKTPSVNYHELLTDLKAEAEKFLQDDDSPGFYGAAGDIVSFLESVSV